MRRRVLLAVLSVALLDAAPARAQGPEDLVIAYGGNDDDQSEYVARYVRMYNRLSTASIPLALVAGAYSLARPGELSLFGGFLFAGIEYGMFLTGVRSDPVSRSLVWAHVGAGVAGGAMAYVGLERFLRKRDAERRERRTRESRLEIFPVAGGGRAGVTATVRF